MPKELTPTVGKFIYVSLEINLKKLNKFFAVGLNYPWDFQGTDDIGFKGTVSPDYNYV
jgi:hypothetical protein